MRVKCIVYEYFDKELGKYIKENEQLEMEDKRANVLIEKGLVTQIRHSIKETKDEK